MRWLDDSKATNPHAAAASLAAHDRVVWLAGGLLKGAEVDDLVLAHRGRLAGVVVLGVDRGAILDALARHAPEVPVVDVGAGHDGLMDDPMTRAARAAASMAHPGDVVLLAPAAASMDMFRDYARAQTKNQGLILFRSHAPAAPPSSPPPQAPQRPLNLRGFKCSVYRRSEFARVHNSRQGP